MAESSEMRLLLFYIAVLSGCVSTAELSKQNFQPKSGEVRLKYNNIGGTAGAEKKAQEIMAQFCAPQKPVVTSREMRPVGYNGYASGYSYSSSVITKPFITFVCE